MDERALNVLGATALGIGDGLTAAMVDSTGLDQTMTAGVVTVLARPGTSVTDLAATLGLTHSGAVRVVARLQAEGFLVRGPGADGRTAGLRLTPRGRSLAETALTARTAFLATVMEGVPPADLRALERVTVTMAERFATTRAEARRVCRLCAHEVCRGSDCPTGRALLAPDQEGRVPR